MKNKLSSLTLVISAFISGYFFLVYFQNPQGHTNVDFGPTVALFLGIVFAIFTLMAIANLVNQRKTGVLATAEHSNFYRILAVVAVILAFALIMIPR